jgi:hypothetical protein
MRFRLKVVAMTLFALAAVLSLWPWHRTYEGRHVTCGPAIFVAFPNDPGTQRGAERRAADECKTLDLKLVVVSGVLVWAGVSAMLWPSRNRPLPPSPLSPPGRITGA